MWRSVCLPTTAPTSLCAVGESRGIGAAELAGAVCLLQLSGSLLLPWLCFSFCFCDKLLYTQCLHLLAHSPEGRKSGYLGSTSGSQGVYRVRCLLGDSEDRFAVSSFRVPAEFSSLHLEARSSYSGFWPGARVSPLIGNAVSHPFSHSSVEPLG